MRSFNIQYLSDKGQHVSETLTENDIRKEYYSYWYEQMCKKYGEEYVNDHYSWKDCLEDWIVVNWAVEVVDESL